MLTVVAASAKNGQTRRVPLNRVATDLLTRWRTQKGTDLNVVRELLGHSDITMVLRYAHLDPKNLAAAVERVAREPAAGVGEGSVAA
jgi:site-specific recombinase XerD